MLEIFFLMSLTRKNAALAEAKGRSKGLFRAMTIILWIFNEMLFAIAGVLILDVSGYALAFIALIGGIIGGLISFLIAKFMPEASNANPNTFTPAAVNSASLWSEPTTVECKACGAVVKLPARFCDTCGAKVENNFG